MSVNVLSGGPQANEKPPVCSEHRRTKFVTIPLDDNTPICRICYNIGGKKRGRLIKPCLCSGTVGGVHRSCIELWLTLTKKTKCTICQFPFRTKIVYKPVQQWVWPPMTAEDIVIVIVSILAHLTVFIQMASLVYVCFYRELINDNALVAFVLTGILIALPWTIVLVVAVNVVNCTSQYWQDWRIVNQRVKLIDDDDSLFYGNAGQ